MKQKPTLRKTKKQNYECDKQKVTSPFISLIFFLNFIRQVTSPFISLIDFIDFIRQITSPCNSRKSSFPSSRVALAEEKLATEMIFFFCRFSKPADCV